MAAPVCFCNACEQKTTRRSQNIPATERHTSQYQEYIRNLNQTSNRSSLFNHGNRKLSKSITISSRETINPLVENVSESNANTVIIHEKEVRETAANNASLDWIKDMDTTEIKIRPNENYIDENGFEQHYSVLMAKVHSELHSIKKAKKKSLKKKTIEFMSSWKKYANKKISFSFTESGKRKIKSRTHL